MLTNDVDEVDFLQLTCKHEDFISNVTVIKMDNSYIAEIVISCVSCGLPFSFNGLPLGLVMDGAAISPDGTEARLSISPGLGGVAVPKE